LTQTALAQRLGSSQLRAAKMEAADRSVSLDLIVPSLLTIGATAGDIAKWIKRAENATCLDMFKHSRRGLEFTCFDFKATICGSPVRTTFELTRTVNCA
jgi:hypothetical protein